MESGSELRTFLFADVRGYTRFTQEHGDEAAARLVAKFAALTREIVHERSGQVIELRGDEALAVFGSARQALRAAVALQARFEQESEADPSLPLPVGIGLDAGEAIPLEGGYRGEALNLAARLCNLAGPGEVLASEGVVYLGRRVPGVFYIERGNVPLKGFADPVRVIRVLGHPAEDEAGPLAPTETPSRSESLPIGGFLGALPSGVLVGRDAEWNRIMSSLEAVMQGSGQLVLLSGEPGIGKTRLAQEVTLKARHWGFLVATGRCYELERAVPFYPFLEALLAIYNASPGSIRAEIPHRWPYLARLLPEELGHLSLPSDGQQDQQRLFRSVTGFLEAVAGVMPIALLLDDLHWADDSSVKLLVHLARYTRGYRILLLGTYRDVELHRQHPLDATLVDLGREGLVEEVHIPRLEQSGTSSLVAEILGGKDDLGDLAELVHRRTEGNAFFIQEVVRTLVERGDVYRKDGRWERGEVDETEVPKSIRSAIGQRLSHLSPAAQEILRDASVLGQRFTFEDLLALGALAPPPSGYARDAASEERSGWSEDEVDAALEAAMTAGLVRETGRDAYAFNHGLTQQALYAELSTRRKKRLHLAAGKTLERLSPTGSRVHPNRWAELAWHFLEGDDAAQALPYALRAGDQAEEVFAHGEAERHYRTASELACELGDTGRKAEALEKLADVLAIVARYDEALELLEQSAQLHRQAGNEDRERSAIAQMGHVHFARGTPEEGITLLQPLVDSLDLDPQATVPSYGLAAMYAALARLYMGGSAHKKQLRAAERAVELARALGDDGLLIGAEITRSDALWELGQDEDALQVLEEVIPKAEAAADLHNLVRALGNAANYYAGRGDLERDRLYQQRALELAERRGDRGQMLLGALQLSGNAFLAGDWARSRQYLDQAEAIIRTIRAIRLSVWPVSARGWLSLREGNLEAAGACAEEALRLAEGVGDLIFIRFAHRLLAEKDLLEGKPEGALSRLQPFLARHEPEPGTSREQAAEEKNWDDDSGFLRTLAMIYLALGNLREARQAATRSIARATARKNQFDLIESLAVQGAVLAQEDSWAEAAQLFEYTLARARRIPFPFGEASLLREYGAMCLRKGERVRAKQLLDEALAIFRRLGARGEVERVESLVSSL